MSGTKSFDILAISLNVPYNYFDSSTKFSDLYLAKFLDISAKPFFPCNFAEIAIYVKG